MKNNPEIPSQQIKFALVGCGRISERHIEAISSAEKQGAKLVAVCDIAGAALKKAAEKTGVAAYYL